METGSDWYAPYFLTHISGKWQISRARVAGEWHYMLHDLKDGKRRGPFKSVEQAKEAAK